MPILVSCWNCGSKLRAPDTMAGTKVKCPKCSSQLTVPVASEVTDDRTAIQEATPGVNPTPAYAYQESPPSPGPAPLPQAIPYPAAQPGTGDMQYIRAYQFIFDHPSWITNLILGSLCALIPIIGGLVLGGYIFELIEAMHEKGDRPYPDFDFNRFGTYLTRGVWPFLFGLIVTIPLFIIVVIFYALALTILPVQLAMAFLLLIDLAVVICSLLILTPASLYIGLRQELAIGAAFQFARDFLKRAWVELLLAELFLMVTTPIVMMGGLILCCIGVVPAAVVVHLAQGHLLYQLYELYLHRGGPPIPLKSSAVSAP